MGLNIYSLTHSLALIFFLSRLGRWSSALPFAPSLFLPFLPSSSLGLEILHGSLSFVLEFDGNGGPFLLSPPGFWFESILCFPFGFPLLGFCSCAGLEGGLVGAGSWGGKSWECTCSRGSRFFCAGCRSPDRCRRRAQAPVAAAHGERRWALGLLEQKASKRTAGRQ